ncbi:hypothetical protein BG004_006727 [Podila humilis]|nr:hypothetical protein BG004_006727 [Podila humilis]
MSLKVLIVGTDVATLTLALILERARIDYVVLEAQESVPVVAGGITLHPTVLSLLEQLGLWDDLLFFSQPLEQVDIVNADMEYITSSDYSQWRTRYGAWSRFMSRPDYCDMVLNKLPESKVLFNKHISHISTLEADEVSSWPTGRRKDSILDSDDIREKATEITTTPLPLGVTCTCIDGSVFSGHIMVGDVESHVECKVNGTSPHPNNHQYLQNPQQQQVLPMHVNTRHSSRSGMGSNIGISAGLGASAERKETSPVREIQYFVSGITEPLDPQRIPLLREDTTQLRLVVDAKNALSWWAATLVDNRIAWQVTKRIPVSEKSLLPEDVGSMALVDDQAVNRVLQQVSPNMMCPLGGTMAQLILWTSRFQTSCKRWDDQRGPTTSPSPRVLLLGEGCRKIIPLLGQTVDESILDALALGEALVGLTSTEPSDIKAAFELYHKERSGRRETAIDEARHLDQLLHSKSIALVLNKNEHLYTVRSSDFLFAYFSYTLIASVFSLYILNDRAFHSGDSDKNLPELKGSDSTTTIFTAFIVLITAAFAVEIYPRSHTKVQILARQKQPLSDYDLANTFSRIVFHYVNPIIVLGASRPLRPVDVEDTMLPVLKTKVNYDLVSAAWERSKARAAQSDKQPSYLFTVLRAYRFKIMIGMALRLLGFGVAFIPTALFSQLLKFIQDYSDAVNSGGEGKEPPPPMKTGLLIAAAMYAAYTASFLLAAAALQTYSETGLQARSATVAMIYNKALKLSPSARQKSTLGEITNHMAVDAEKMITASNFFAFYLYYPVRADHQHVPL